LFCIICCFSGILYSSETLDTAEQISKGKFRTVVYYTQTKAKPTFQMVDFSTTTGWGINKVDGDSSFGNVVVKLVLNPFDKLNWWARAGMVSDYKLGVPSTDTPKIEYTNISSYNGYTIGAGAKYQVFPQTDFNCGICLDFGVVYTNYIFNRKYQENIGYSDLSGTKFEDTEFHAKFNLSRKIRKTEPYGGVSIYRNWYKFGSNSGTKDNINVFAGLKVKLRQLKWLMCEANLIGETSLSAGFCMAVGSHE